MADAPPPAPSNNTAKIDQDDDVVANSGRKITVYVKTTKEKQSIQVAEGATIKEFKELVADIFKAEIDQLCLIFAGKIMKDQDTLINHNIKDGLTVHLVVKTAPRTSEAAPSRPADVNATPFNLGSLGGLSGLETLGLGSANFVELQSRMQGELLGNPEMLRQVLDNPLVQRLMNDPENMRMLITSNPQMQDLIERNPEINHMLNNPELLRQTMELARNPSMLQELMRTHDRAINNLESIPGGYNALQRMYRDIQEPMLNAASEQFGGNPFGGLVDGSTGGANPQQGTENRDPLPNPWVGRGERPPSTTASSAPRLNLNNPSMSSLLQQMSENTPMVQNMFSAPYTRQMLQALSADPNLASSILAQNPLLNSNPALQQQMRTMMPQFLQQLQNPEMQNLMTNPQALNALMQIQQGMETLQQTAPGVIDSLGISRPPSFNVTGTQPAVSNTSGSSPTSPSAAPASETAPVNNTTTGTAAPPQNQPLDSFSEVKYFRSSVSEINALLDNQEAQLRLTEHVEVPINHTDKNGAASDTEPEVIYDSLESNNIHIHENVETDQTQPKTESPQFEKPNVRSLMSHFELKDVHQKPPIFKRNEDKNKAKLNYENCITRAPTKSGGDFGSSSSLENVKVPQFVYERGSLPPCLRARNMKHAIKTRSLDEEAFDKEFGSLLLERRSSVDENFGSKYHNVPKSLNRPKPIPIDDQKLDIHLAHSTDSIAINLPELNRERIEKYKEERRKFLQDKYRSESFKEDKDVLLSRFKQKVSKVKVQSEEGVKEFKSPVSLRKIDGDNIIEENDFIRNRKREEDGLKSERRRHTFETQDRERETEADRVRRISLETRNLGKETKSYCIKDMKAIFESKSQQ